ncbi:hypothetical protein Tco_0537419 [Tanacetum coccineum]
MLAPESTPDKFKWTEMTCFKFLKGYDIISTTIVAAVEFRSMHVECEKLLKESQELKIVSYHKLYDILKQQQNEVNEIRAERLARTANPLALIKNKKDAEDDALSKEKETDKLMALISLSFKKIYKPTNNNLRTSSNTSRANQDNTPRINRGTGEKMILCKQEEDGIQLSAEQADWRDDTDDEPDDQELEAHILYIGQPATRGQTDAA